MNEFSEKTQICEVPVLARMFSSSVIKDFATKETSHLAKRLLHESNCEDLLIENVTLGQLFDNIFYRLLKQYRCEYVYKNALAEKLLLGKHSINTAFMATEIRVGSCKADVVLYNGTSHAFEIKTEHDSYTRLESQLFEYSKVFEFCWVLVPIEHAKKIISIIPEHVGVLGLTKRYSLRVHREPVSLKDNVEPQAVFELLRASEYKPALKEHYDEIADVSPSSEYAACERLFSQLPSVLAHEVLVSSYKARGRSEGQKSFVVNMPSSLKAAAIAVRLTSRQKATFLSTLKRPVKDVLVTP